MTEALGQVITPYPWPAGSFEDVLARALDSPPCICEFVDIGVGFQKVSEYSTCPNCTLVGQVLHVMGALADAGRLAALDDVRTLAQYCKTYADGDVYLAATRVLHSARKATL